MSNRREKLDHVELLNVPWYSQGTFDGLCAYYTGAMMLSTLFPEYALQFGKAARQRNTKNVSGDPLVICHPNNPGDDRHTLSKWFYQGECIKTVTQTLNRLMVAEEKHARFEFKGMGAYDHTLSKTIVDSIEAGLPVMLSWSAKDYGDHAVLVTGYREGAERWLILNDPGGMSEISWDSLKRQKKGLLEIGLCRPNTFHGPRPMKWKQSGDDEPTVYQWTPHAGYKPLEEIFGNENSPSPFSN